MWVLICDTLIINKKINLQMAVREQNLDYRLQEQTLVDAKY